MSFLRWLSGEKPAPQSPCLVCGIREDCGIRKHKHDLDECPLPEKSRLLLLDEKNRNKIEKLRRLRL